MLAIKPFLIQFSQILSCEGTTQYGGYTSASTASCSLQTATTYLN